MSEVLIDFLERRFALKEAPKKLIEDLILSWRSGHTARLLTDEEKKSLGDFAGVSNGGEKAFSPLVLTEDLLQSRQHFEIEKRIAEKIKSLLTTGEEVFPEQLLIPFESITRGDHELQVKAVKLSLMRRFFLLVGGPGTGKTRTVGKVLALKLFENPDLRFALCAPTGKAAQRLGESISSLDFGSTLLDERARGILSRVEEYSTTLHRLLGWRPGEDQVGFDAHRPLLFDFLIVDEASMMDIHLWDTLLQAIKPTTSIIFLGDPDQLESIQPGRVLGSLVSSAESGGIVSRAFVKLTENFRFKKRPLIGILADAASPRSDADFVACLERVREQDVNQVERMVSEDFPSRADESRHDRHEIRKALQTIFPALEKLGRSRDPKAALDAIGEVRILCAVNQGRFGVSGLNAEVEKLFASVGESAVTRPILIRENDPTTGLFNGDLGVVIESTEGRASKAYFYRGKKMVEFSISKLPEHETAWAMTVHRSQGSEYRTVLLVLPPVKRETATEDKLEFMGKELLFTAITRAKEKVIFLASDERLKSICQRQEFRRTGLPERLKV